MKHTVKNIDVFAYLLEQNNDTDTTICLDYSKKFITDKDANHISSIITNYSNDNIHVILDISSCRSEYAYYRSEDNDSSIFLLKNILHSGHEKIITINASYSDLKSQDLYKIINALVHPDCPQKITLNLTNKYFDDSHMVSIARLITSGNCPKELHLILDYHYVTNDGIAALLTAIQSPLRPVGLQLDIKYHDAIIKKAFKESHDKRQEKYVGCVAFQQGLNKKLNLSKISQECAKEIYGFLVSFKNSEEKNHFNNKVMMASKPKSWPSSSTFFMAQKQIQSSKDAPSNTCTIS